MMGRFQFLFKSGRGAVSESVRSAVDHAVFPRRHTLLDSRGNYTAVLRGGRSRTDRSDGSTGSFSPIEPFCQLEQPRNGRHPSGIPGIFPPWSDDRTQPHSWLWRSTGRWWILCPFRRPPRWPCPLSESSATCGAGWQTNRGHLRRSTTDSGSGAG